MCGDVYECEGMCSNVWVCVVFVCMCGCVWCLYVWVCVAFVFMCGSVSLNVCVGTLICACEFECVCVCVCMFVCVCLNVLLYGCVSVCV